MVCYHLRLAVRPRSDWPGFGRAVGGSGICPSNGAQIGTAR